ncbi:uncharacterized protein LOC119371884 [Rhipicephalus sanguineus]|uniref:Uncharacterized protein n=1 Tax=Rhipicephalus sanguineus TaxID=34632 RepID=A0A9D4QF10_RHISA|nr:uncharacterized protein LOC119371884 [Rhipicephalus sanguineus]KAH7976544.1 hypothetical protein HPB52_016091 [Rhipicephalus sanguineus]
MNVSLRDDDVVKLFGVLESNRTISALEIHCITFWRRTSKALGRLVENNRLLVLLTITVNKNDTEVDSTLQARYICRELKEAIVRNRFLIGLTVELGISKPSNEPAIKNALGRNMILVNEATRFVAGSMHKTDALAFETLQHCESVRMNINYNRHSESAASKIAQARERLALNYFVLTGVVKAKIVCHRNRKAKKKKTLFDNIGRHMQARICSYLSLTDVLDA